MKIHDKLGEDALIVLLNSRLSAQVGQGGAGQREANELQDLFVSTFHYAPPAVDPSDAGDRELLLFHEFGRKWYLGEKSGGKGVLGLGQGGFETLWEGEARPSQAELRAALASKQSA